MSRRRLLALRSTRLPGWVMSVKLGVWKRGKKADFVVLDKDPGKARNIAGLKVLETWVGAESAFKGEE